MIGKNIYITLNMFYKLCRRLENIKELNTLFIDLDYYVSNLNESDKNRNLREWIFKIEYIIIRIKTF